jgi:hypothetical protein
LINTQVSRIPFGQGEGDRGTGTSRFSEECRTAWAESGLNGIVQRLPIAVVLIPGGLDRSGFDVPFFAQSRS